MHATEEQIQAAVDALTITEVRQTLRDIVYHLYGETKLGKGHKMTFSYSQNKEWNQSTVEMIDDVIREVNLTPDSARARFYRNGRAKK